MNGKRGLVIATVALVAVLAAGGVAYGVLGQNAANPATTQHESASGDAASGSSDNMQSGTGNTPASSGTEVSSSSTDSQATSASSGTSTPGGETMVLLSFTVQDRQGNSVDTSTLVGKPAIVCFWATWCPPCNAEAPHIQALYEQYGEAVNFMMVNVTDGDRDTPEAVEQWIAEGGYTYPIYLDTTLEASNACQVYYLPTTFALDAQGNVLTAFSGALDESSGEDLIQQLLAS